MSPNTKNLDTLFQVCNTSNARYKAYAYTLPDKTLEREFKPAQQTLKLLIEQAPRLVITYVIVALVILTLKLFENDGNVSHNYKYIFNVIMTVLGLALGLNFLEAYKDLAKVLRWRILANRSYTIRELDLILGGESLMKLITLMGESLRKPLTLLVCASWVFMNLAAQGSIAVMGLTYSMDSGYASNGTYTKNGRVNVSKLDCYYSFGNCLQAAEAGMAVAHDYGQLTRGRTSCAYSNDSDISKANQLCYYFNNLNGQEFAYRFNEYNPGDSTSSYPFLTNRTVKASAGQCYEYAVNTDNPNFIDIPDGIGGAQVFPIYNETYNGTITIPRATSANDATTWIYNGTERPQDATFQACGPRCLWMYAFRSQGVITQRSDAVFSCPITVTDVNNASRPFHSLPPDIARLAAASIALTGRYTNPDGADRDWRQYTLYPWGSDWEINGLSAQEVGSRMAEFALGSVAGMATLNPSQLQPGTLPILGYNLSIHWRYIIALSACIAGVHALLVALMLWIARPVIIIDDSNLCTARLLQGLVGRLDGGGSLLDGQEIARAIQRECLGNGGSVVYGIKPGGAVGAPKTLGLGEDINVRKRLPRGRFPHGGYT